MDHTYEVCRRKLRILFIIENLGGGGAERVTLNLIRHLDRKRFEPVLFLVERAGVYFPDVPQDVKVIYGSGYLRYNKYLTPYYLGKLLLEACRSDVIIGALEIRSTYLAYMAGALTGRPVVGWVRTMMDKWLKEWRAWHSSAVSFVYPRLRYVVCISNAVAQSIRSVASIKPERLRVIYNLLEIDSIIKKGQEEPPQWYVDILGKPAIIAVSQMKHRKGLDILIEAHAKVLGKDIPHNLVIVGSGHLKKGLEDLTKSLNVASSVFMPGYILNPYNLINNTTALVCPSRYEGLSNVIIEAMALGTPVVSTACGGPIELLSDGKYGILVPPEDADALADGIIKILSNPCLAEKFSKSGIERARYFSPANMVPHWEQLLMEIGR